MTVDDFDLDSDLVDDTPLPPLLPVLSLAEAQGAVAVLAAVVNGGQPDREVARWVLGNLAARVPSRDLELDEAEKCGLPPSKAFEKILRPRERSTGMGPRRRLIAELCGDSLPEDLAAEASNE